MIRTPFLPFITLVGICAVTAGPVAWASPKKTAAHKGAAHATTDGRTGHKVFFISPQNSATVPSTFRVRFGVAGFKVRPAGEDATDKSSGHHHLIVDAGPMAEGEVIPMDDTHKHFGKGQTETEITLAPGNHKLTMQFADGAHRSYGESMSASIEVTVVAVTPKK